MKVKKIVVSCLIAAFGFSAIGCGNSSSNGGSATSVTPTLVIQEYPLNPDYIQQQKDYIINVKNGNLQNSNLKTGLLGDTLDTVTDATNFLNIFAVAVPEIGFITAPATFIEGIFASDSLDTSLQDLSNAINNLQDEMQDIQNEINASNQAITASFNQTAQNYFATAASNYNTQLTNGNTLSDLFAAGYAEQNGSGTWTPAQGLNLPVAQLPQVVRFNDTFTNNPSATGILSGIAGIATDVNKTTNTTVVTQAPDSYYATVLSANYQLFVNNTFSVPYGNTLPGGDLASQIQQYNAGVANYYYNAIAQLQNIYIMQKTANILNQQQQYSSAVTYYQGPLSGFNLLTYTYTTDTNGTYSFNQIQTNLDTWLVGAVNVLFTNTVQFIISDTPFVAPPSGESWMNPGTTTPYPYNATSQIQSQFANIIMPSTIKTQSLRSPDPLNGGMPQITIVPNQISGNQFVFYVEQALGNPYQYIAQYTAAWESGTPFTAIDTNSSIFAINSQGDVMGYISQPGFYDGQNFWLWTIDQWANPIATASTNLANRCNNNGANITMANDGGSINGANYPPQTFGWNCYANISQAYVPNNVNAITSYESSGQPLGLMSPGTDSFVAEHNNPAIGSTTISGNNTVNNGFMSQYANDTVNTPNPALYNMVMYIGNYNFAPTFSVTGESGDNTTFTGTMYCPAGDPLCSVDPVTNQICVAGQIVSVNWINGGTFMIGAYLQGTTTPQHCYNSSGPQKPLTSSKIKRN